MYIRYLKIYISDEVGSRTCFEGTHREGLVLCLEPSRLELGEKTTFFDQRVANNKFPSPLNRLIYLLDMRYVRT